MTLKSSLRSALYQTEKLTQRARFALRNPVSSRNRVSEGWPILLGISFPKSGTHLLDQILLGFSQVAPFSKRLHSFYAEYEGETGVKRDAKQAVDWLRSLRPLDVASAHLFARPEAVEAISGLGLPPVRHSPEPVAVSVEGARVGEAAYDYESAALTS